MQSVKVEINNYLIRSYRNWCLV